MESKVICNNSGKALYCKKDCVHGRLHEPKTWQDLTDCKTKSKCCIIEKVCQCVEPEMKIIK